MQFDCMKAKTLPEVSGEKRKGVQKMKHNRTVRFLVLALALVMALTFPVAPVSAARNSRMPLAAGAMTSVVDPDQGVILVSEETKQANSEAVTILVGIAEDTVYMQTGDLNLAADSFETQMAVYNRTEASIEAALNEKIKIDTHYSLLFNGFSFTGEKWMIDAINQIPGLVAMEDITFELVAGTPTEETVTVSPSMFTSTENTAAQAAWALGYTGEGMVIAIIDSGIRKTHEAFSVEPENAKIDKRYLEQVFDQFGDKLHSGDASLINKLYFNAKLPYCWDYIENDADPQHTNTDHGTHVAGIAAGNNGKDFKGVAPDAQIIPMGVFDSDGGATFTTIMAAMEDCVYLGVDAINMSLGVTAFFSAYEALDAYIESVYATLEEAGISVVAAAGNDNNASLWNNYSLQYDKARENGMWPMMNIDTGVVGAPASFPGSLCVASVQNSGSVFGAFNMSCNGTVYDVEGYPDQRLTNMTGAYELVWCGIATTDNLAALEEAGISLEGKIALCSRNDILYGEKCANVAAAGAVACIIMNSMPNNRYYPEFESEIPCGLITNEVGQALLNSLNGSIDIYYNELPLGLTGKVSCAKEANYNIITPSVFSSWGTTAGLEIKPEISAPGGAVTSSVGFGTNNSYGTWDGTSMATPHVAGGMLLVKQSLREKYPEATAAEINALAHNYIMSTSHGIDYVAVRKQGAGMIDLASAVSATAYATVKGGRPKLELDDSTTGTFDLVFTVHNDGDAPKYYDIDVHALTMYVDDLEFTGYRENWGYNQDAYRAYNQKYGYFLSNDESTWVKVTQGNMRDVTDMVSVDGNTSISVPAGGTTNVMLTLTCSEDLMEWFEWECPAGNYLEGFVRLNEISAPSSERSIQPAAAAGDFIDLSLPFLGFVGDWDYVPMFDDGFWWQIPHGEANLAQSTEAQGTFVGFGADEQGLGMNSYASMKGKPYLDERNAISPNGDGILDAVDSLEFALMRNPRNLKVYLEDADGNLLHTFFDQDYWYRKEFYTAGLNGGTSFSAMELSFDWSSLKENETVYLVMEAWLDDHPEYDPEDNYNGRMRFPITIDTEAPELIPEFYNPSEPVSIGLNVMEENFVSYYAVYADKACTELLYELAPFSTVRGNWEGCFNSDWRDPAYRTEYYVFAADYAGNEVFAKCTFEGKMFGTVTELNAADCPASQSYNARKIIGRQMVNWNTGSNEYAFVELDTISGGRKEPVSGITYSNPDYDAGWGWDFTAAAVRYDGTLFINSFRHLAILDPETYEVTYVAKFNNEHASYDPSVRNIMSHPETGEIYAFAYIIDDVTPEFSGEYYCKVDTETGYLTPIWKITNDLAADAEIWNWAYAYVDADTVAIYANHGYFWLVNEDDGTLIQEIFTDFYAPSGEQQTGINGTGGNMLYDATTNKLFVYSNWMWMGFNRYNTGGYIEFDLDTNEVEYHGLGAGMGYTVYGLYFADEVVAKSWYPVVELIDAIKKAESLDSLKAAIDAARAAYDALSPEDQALIPNYQDLLDAEAMYENMLAEIETARTEALAAIDALRGTATGCAYCRQAFEALLDEAAETVKNAATATEIVSAMEILEHKLNLIECPSKDFADVKDGDWWHEAVDYVVSKGYMVGMDDTHYGPAATMNRAQFVSVLYRMEGNPDANNTGVFTDVPEGRFYTEAAYWALENGITAGATASTFNPGGQLTRTELVAFMYRYAKYKGYEVTTGDLSGYTDADKIQSFAVDAWSWAVNAGIVTGMTADTLAPMNLTNRAQAAVIFQRFDLAVG